MTSWKEYKKDWVLLLEGGFIAVNQGDEDSAVKLFKAAELLSPEHIMPKIGFGYLHLHKLELKQAVHFFEQALKMDPHSDMAKALLGVSMSLAPNSIEKGEKILHQTEKSRDPLIKSLSSSTIDFVERFVKKAPTPVEGSRKHPHK